MIIVAGHLVVDHDERDAYLRGCEEVVAAARRTPGCLEFSVSADLLQPGRIVIFERWAAPDAVQAFLGSGPSEEQGAAILSAAVTEYEVTAIRPLT
jgi:quinol monooxygenase YgiN